jgi:hypothetical protein
MKASGSGNTIRPRAGARLAADDPVALFPVEAPTYEGLERAITRVWTVIRDAFVEMRDAWWAITGLPDEELAGRAARAQRQETRPLTAAQKAALDRSLETFLTTMAGRERDLNGFSAQDMDDGIIQQSVYLAHQVGRARAIDLTGTPPRNPALSEQQRQSLAEIAFQRLSEGSRLRFETRLDGLLQRMNDAFRRGESPLVVARDIAGGLRSELSKLRTIARTEMGFAAIGGQQQHYSEVGVTRVTVIGDPRTDELCTVHIGQEYGLFDRDNLPLYHPNCFCDIVPILPSR